SLAVSLFTLMNMLRLWQKAFWGETDLPDTPTLLTSRARRWATLAPIAVLVALSLTIGLFAGPFFHWSGIAARQVMDREGYIAAVAPTDEIEYLGVSDGE